MISGENPISIGLNGVEIQLIEEVQKFRGFRRENNECIRKGEKTKLHEIKIVGFLT